jgi:chemotaxis protein MotB
MRRKKRAKEDSGTASASSWLTTYSDLVTLLMCFWVLLYSMSILDLKKFDALKASIRSAFIGDVSILPVHDGDAVISITPYEDNEPDAGDSEDNEAQRLESIKDAKADIQGLVDKMGLNENIKVLEEESKIILRMDSLILFDTGKADIKSSAEEIIEKVGVILESLDTEIMVQGHADDRPINTPVFPSNWELSTKRATNVVKFLIDRCGLKENNLTAAGNAEFKPIAPNDTEYNMQKNRRIDIVIFK